MSEAAAAPAAPEVPAAAPANAAVETPAPDTPAPEKTFTQKELDEILEKRLSKERRKREELKQERDVLRKLALERGEQPRNDPPAKPAESGEPKREQFADYESFIEARAEWRAEQAVEKKLAKKEEEAKTRTATEQQLKQAEEFKKRTKDSAKDLEDFDEVMAEATDSPDKPVSRLFADPINECENPAAVLYHLAKNPEEAERIASMGAAKQAREIWALEQKLKAGPPPKKPSSAPAPITPVGGKGNATDDEPDPGNTKAWIAWRNRQVAKKRK